MDRRQLVVQRTREIFGNRLDDVIQMVRNDRQGLRGWEEPAHLRAVLRRSIQEMGSNQNQSITLTEEPEVGRSAGEPERGQQREAVGQLLEAGGTALEKICQSSSNEISPQERLGLECVLFIYGRPAISVGDSRLAAVPAYWNILEDQREEVELAQTGVGRIELMGHPEYDWAGTGFLVNESTLMTTRRIAETFVEYNGSLQFRPGITSWMDYRPDFCDIASAGYRIRGVVGMHDKYDVALLEVEPPQTSHNGMPTPLALASEAPSHQLADRPVYMISYPIRDSRRNEPEIVARVFRDVYNVKRVQPGTLQSMFQFREVQLLRHNCSSLGQTCGGCIIDMETHQVLGMQVTGRYLEDCTAIPLWVLRDDPLFQRAGVTFCQANSDEFRQTSQELERLARSRFWNEARETIARLYQQAFGNSGSTNYFGSH